MKQVNLQDVGLTDRYNRNRAQSNFKAIEDAVNSNAITAEGMYAELNGKLAAEANARKAGDEVLEQELRSEMAAEANARKAGDDSEARDRRAADEELEQGLRSELVAGDHALDHKYAAEIDRLDQADSDIKSLITSVEKRLNVRIDDLASDMRAADESNLAALTAKAERVAVGSDGPTFIRMLGWALHDPKIRDVVANIVKE